MRATKLVSDARCGAYRFYVKRSHGRQVSLIMHLYQLAVNLDGGKSVSPTKPESDYETPIWDSVSFCSEGPRPRHYWHTAALRLIVQPCDEYED
jgi:hypothetical protein